MIYVIHFLIKGFLLILVSNTSHCSTSPMLLLHFIQFWRSWRLKMDLMVRIGKYKCSCCNTICVYIYMEGCFKLL